MPPLGGYRRPFFFSFFFEGRVLGKFLASSWRIPGEFLANSCRDLGFGPPNLVQKASKIELDGSEGRLNSIKNQGIFGHRFREAPESANPNVPEHSRTFFWPKCGAQIIEFSCYFVGFVF